MEEKHSLVGLERAVSLPPPPADLKCDAEDMKIKKQNCLCAPTTHAGSFRCRLHRRPPPSPIFSQHAVKKGPSSQKLLAPKVKVALHHKIKQGCGKRPSSCSTSSRIQQELPALSRLSRTSVAIEQKQSSWSDQEALTSLWKTSSTVVSGDEALQSEKQVVSSDASGEELSSLQNKTYIRPLVRLPSI
eukprot:c37279_g1_i1 orf=220-783(+)